MLIRTFVLKAINNERKILTHHEVTDRFAEQIVPVWKKLNLWIHPKL